MKLCRGGCISTTHFSYLRLILFLFIVTSFFIVSASADTSNISIQQDTYNYEFASGTNYNQYSYMYGGCAAGESNRERYIYLQYDLSSLPENIIITGADLNILQISTNAEITNLDSYRVTQSWTDSTLTWSNKPTTTASNDSRLVTYSGTAGWHHINVLDMARGWENGTYPNYGMALINTTAGSPISPGFNSSAAVKRSSTLLITYEVSEYSTITLTPDDNATRGKYGNLIGENQYDYIDMGDLGGVTTMTAADYTKLTTVDGNDVVGDGDASHDGYVYVNYTLPHVGSVDYIKFQVHGTAGGRDWRTGFWNTSDKRWYGLHLSSADELVTGTYDTGANINKYSHLDANNNLTFSLAVWSDNSFNVDMDVDYMTIEVRYIPVAAGDSYTTKKADAFTFTDKIKLTKTEAHAPRPQETFTITDKIKLTKTLAGVSYEIDKADVFTFTDKIKLTKTVGFMNISTIKDTYVYEYVSGTNYDGYAYLLSGCAAGASDRERYVYIQFDLSNIPANTKITDATLNIHQYTADAATTKLDVYKVTSAWTANSVTWNDKPSHAATNDVEKIITYSSTTGWHEIDVLDTVQGWNNGTYSNYGFSIWNVTAGSPISPGFNSSEGLYGKEAHLAINYVSLDIVNKPDTFTFTDKIALDKTTAEVTYEIDKADTVTITDKIKTTKTLAPVTYEINKPDTFTVTDKIKLTKTVASVSYDIDKADTLTISDAIKMIKTLGAVVYEINKPDTVTITDTIKLTKTVAPVVYEICVQEVITITDKIALEIFYHLDKADTITISDAIALSKTLAPVLYYTKKEDSITITDKIKLTKTVASVSYTTNKPDTFTFTDKIKLTKTAAPITYEINKPDTFTVTDKIKLTKTTAGVSYNINKPDTFTVSDKIALSKTIAPIKPQDTFTFTDNIALDKTVAGVVYSIDKADVFTFTDKIKLTKTAAPITYSIDKADAVTITDNIATDKTVAGVSYDIDKPDAFTFTDKIAMDKTAAPIYYEIDIADTFTFTDKIAVDKTVAGVSYSFNVADTFTVTDNIAMNKTLASVGTIPDPTNLQHTTGDYWVNFTWDKGAGNLTDSWNVSQNGTWMNGTTEDWNNSNVGVHGTSTIIVYAYNTSGDGTRSHNYVTDSITVDNNAITLTNLSANVVVNETDVVYVYADATDSDGDAPTFWCSRTDLFTFDTATGTGSWVTHGSSNDTYNVDFGVIDGYGSTDNFSVRIVVNDTVYAPTVTLLSMTPSEICQNCTGCMNISYGVSHDSSGLNNARIAFIYRNYDYDMSDSNHSIRPPNNSIAANWDLDGRILRAANRNETLNFENNASITGGDIYSWSGFDYNNSELTVVPINGTYTKIYINGTLHHLMPQMWYLDRSELQEAPKTQFEIHRNQNVLVKFWNYEIFKGNTDFLGVGYTDTALNDNPALWPSEDDLINYYYVNNSYNPATDGDPITSGFAIYMGSLNFSEWVNHVYEPHANASYVRGFINNTLLEQYIRTDEISYLYFTSDTPSAKPFYINVTGVATSTNIDFDETNVMWAGDETLTQQAYTPNIWFAFMKANMAFEHKLYVADTINKWGNSTISSTVIEEALFPPTKPDFYAFHDGFTCYDMNGTYDGTFEVQIGTSSDPDGGVTTHNLSLHYGKNNTFVAVINNTFYTPNGIFANISFDSSVHYSDVHNYTMRIIATDNEGESATTWLGENFTLFVTNFDNFTWSNESITAAAIPQNQYFTYSTDIVDYDGTISSAKISINGVNHTMINIEGNKWQATVQGLLVLTYSIDRIWATDNDSATNSTTSDLICQVLKAGGGGGEWMPTPTPTPTPTPVPTEIPEEIIEKPPVDNISDAIKRLISDDVITIIKFNFDPTTRTYQKTMIVDNSIRCEVVSDVIKSCSVSDEVITVSVKFNPDDAFIFYHALDYITVFEDGVSHHINVDTYVINFMASINLPNNEIDNPSKLLFSSDESKHIKGARVWWLLMLIIIIGVIYYWRKKNE